MRTLDLLRAAVRNTFRSKLRTALTVVAIFIGAFTLTLTSAVGTGVSDYITTQVSAIGSSDSLTVTKTQSAQTATGSGPAKYDPSTVTSTSQGGRQGAPGTTVAELTGSDIDRIRGIDGVRSVTPAVALRASWISAGHGKWQVSFNPTIVSNADLAAGAQLDQSTSARQILLPTTYLHNLGLGSATAAVGSSVTIGIQDYAGVMHTVTATVVGVQNATLFTSGATANDALRQALTTAQRTGTPSSVPTAYGSATVTVAAGSTPAQISAVQHRLTDAGYTGRTIADQLGSLLTVIDGIVGVLDAFALIALLAAGFGIVNTLLMSVQERTREIGLMKAMGMGAGRVFALFSLEAVFIGFLGSAIGAAVAIGIGSFVSDRLGATLLSDLPGLQILRFTPATVAVIVLVVMAISFVAGTLPARRAAKQDPIEALRYE